MRPKWLQRCTINGILPGSEYQGMVYDCYLDVSCSGHRLEVFDPAKLSERLSVRCGVECYLLTRVAFWSDLTFATGSDALSDGMDGGSVYGSVDLVTSAKDAQAWDSSYDATPCIAVQSILGGSLIPATTVPEQFCEYAAKTQAKLFAEFGPIIRYDLVGVYL